VEEAATVSDKADGPVAPGGRASQGDPIGTESSAAFADQAIWQPERAWATPPSPPRPPGLRSRHTRTVALSVAVLVIAGIGVVLGHFAWTSTTGRSTVRVPTTSPATPPSFSIPTTTPGQGSSASGAPANAATLAQATDRTLVDINTVISSEAVEGSGTGMVLTSSGEILTNNHVIEGETSISVTDVGNGKAYGATIVGYDPSQDVAVIQLDGASGLKTVNLGNSSPVATGDGVVAVGNAQGAGGTPSYGAGSVTATDQSITAEDEVSGQSEQLSGLIETNATIEPGDSGGALVDSSGRVIGMVTAGSTGFQFQNSTEGYAIPINQAVAIAKQIAAGHASATVHIGPTAFLGVEVQSAFSGVAGAEIVEALPGDPAAIAGLAPGDTIIAVGPQSVTSPESLTTVLLGEAPGDSVPVKYDDLSGQQHTVTVQLGSGPPQ
jgi:S1-C subfamily serine protease